MYRPGLPNTEADFWDCVNKDTESGCWEWTGYIKRSGYGVFGYKGGYPRVHRLVMEFAGHDLTGKVVCHRCDNRKCVNPEHLFVGTAEDNRLDMMAKGRNRNGSKKLRKLTDDEVREVRNSTLPYSQLAKKFSLSAPTVCKIRQRERYKEVI
jgi:hypothetical protein